MRKPDPKRKQADTKLPSIHDEFKKQEPEDLVQQICRFCENCHCHHCYCHDNTPDWRYYNADFLTSLGNGSGTSQGGSGEDSEAKHEHRYGCLICGDIRSLENAVRDGVRQGIRKALSKEDG